MDVTDKALLEAIISKLARDTGRGRGHWRRRIVGFRFREVAHDICNWNVEANGTADEMLAIGRVVDALRVEYPIAVPA
jgi:hypothetical protein